MPIAAPVEQRIVSEVEQWEGVSTVEKRDGAVEFTYSGDDFGHVDDDGSVDLPLSSKLRAALVEAGRTEPHPVYDTSGWTTYWVKGEADAEEAVKCLRLAYVYYVMKASQEEGKEQLAENIDLESELDAFGADERTRELMLGMRK